MKLTINKLIANDIINYGLSRTTGFDYSVFLDSYIDDYDEDDQKYILKNLDCICTNIKENENVSNFNYDKDKKMFDMTFYWDNLLNDLEKKTYNKSIELDEPLEIDDIRSISTEIINDDSIENLLVEKIRNTTDKEMEL